MSSFEGKGAIVIFAQLPLYVCIHTLLYAFGDNLALL